MLSADVSGLAGLLTSLGSAGKRARAAAQRALDREGGKLADKIRAAAPQDEGDLVESVRVEPGEEEPGIVIAAGGEATTTTSSKSGRPYDHSLAVEFGTQKMTARPFFYPTIRAHARDLRRNVGREIQDELKD